MRRGWQTVELWAFLTLAAFCVWRLPPAQRAIAVSALSAGYMVSRMLFKFRRGMFYSSVKTTEMYVFLASLIVVYPVFQSLWYLAVINCVIFSLCRGRTKAIGIITQFIR